MTSAAEKLAEQGAAWVAIGEALKTAKLMSKKNLEVNRILEETKKQADALENLQITNDEAFKTFKPPLDELKMLAGKISNSGINMKKSVDDLIKEANEFDIFVREKIKHTTVPSVFMAEFCKLLDNLSQMGKAFSKAFSQFISDIQTIEKTAKTFTDLMETKKEEILKSAESAKSASNAGAGVAVGGAVIGVGSLIALGFFTGGAAWVAAAVAGGVSAAGGAAVAATKAINLSGLNKLASEIEAYTNKLNIIVREMKITGDNAVEFKLDEKATEALENALTYFQHELETQEKMAAVELEVKQEKAKNYEKDAELARERAEKEKLIAEIQALKNK